MQKIQSYLYPNRVQIIADLAGFTTEYRQVYARTVKIYNGIDNTVQFEIMNTDQKRLDLTQYTGLTLNIMDYSDKAVASYSLTNTSIQGIATAKILNSDIENLQLQKLKYTITGSDLHGNAVLFYTDTNFNAVGVIDVADHALPITRPDKVYSDFYAEVDYLGNPTYHSSAIPAVYYEAVTTSTMNFAIHVTGFSGQIWLDAATTDTVSISSWTKAGQPFGSWNWINQPNLYTGIIPFGSNIPVGNYKYFRVSYKTTLFPGLGAQFNVTQSPTGVYGVSIVAGGTNYGVGALIKIDGSQLGGVSGTNDLILTVTAVNQPGIASSYYVSSIAAMNWTGTSISGNNTFLVTGTNYSGTVDSVTVS